MCKYVYILIIYLMPLQAIAIEPISAPDLLDKYRATQDRLKRFIAKGETTREGTIQAGGELSWMNCTGKITKSVSEIRYDGDRISLRSYSWGGIANKNVPEANAHYRSILWDGKTYIQYATAKTEESGVAFVKKHDRSKKTEIALGYRGAPLMGICFVDDEPVDVMLRQPETISVRDETEQIGGSPCYVIDAVTRHGKYTVWIDPQHGYNIARVELRRGPGDLRRQEPLKNMTTSFSLRNVRFEKVGDVWIPMEADYQKTETRERTQTFDGMFTESKWHHKRTEIVLNPDFEAMSAFIPDDIKDGTKVYVVGVPAIRYKWLNGELVPNVDEAVIDEIDKVTADIMKTLTTSKSVLDSLTVSELLDKYAATQSRLQSFIAKAESKIEYGGTSSRTVRTEKQVCELRFDGNRVYHRSFLLPDRADYKSFLWDGKSFIKYKQGLEPRNNTVFIEKNDDSKKGMIATEYKGAPLMGICAGDYERVDSVLCKADNISLQQKTEQVGNLQCYVIDAVTKRGKYKVWIDPEHGYNIAKIEVQRKKGDLVRDRGRAKTDMSFSLKNVRFEQIDAVWVPMEADMQQTEDSGAKITKWHHKRTEMILNPDHDVLGSFVADDISDGTKVKVLGDPRIYVWQNGRPIVEVDSNAKP